LLLWLAEHVGFTAAYWVAAGTVTALVGIYGSVVLGRRLRGLVLAAVLGHALRVPVRAAAVAGLRPCWPDR
jgi:inner membrane protein involved in colicin E2 resistance